MRAGTAVTGTTGIINRPKAKASKPKSSPKSFKWIVPNDATDADRQKFAATLQELLPPKNWTHVHLAKELWGVDERENARNIGIARGWVKAVGRYPTEHEAGYVAEVLDVSLQRLTEPTGTFDPNTPMVRPMRMGQNKKKAQKPGPKPGTPKVKAKANGHDTEDRRWILPTGVEQPVVKLETFKDHAAFMLTEFKGPLPSGIAMEIMMMVNAWRPEKTE